MSPVKRSNAADVVLRTNPKSDGASFIMVGLIVFFPIHLFIFVVAATLKVPRLNDDVIEAHLVQVSREQLVHCFAFNSDSHEADARCLSVGLI